MAEIKVDDSHESQNICVHRDFLQVSPCGNFASALNVQLSYAFTTAYKKGIISAEMT